MNKAELIKRLEEASGPPQALDRQIAREIGWHRVEPRHGGGKHGGWIAPEDFLGVESSGKPRLDSLHGTTIHRDPPHYTSSIDAAMTLVPEGWAYHIHCIPWDRMNASVSNGEDKAFGANAKTPALALCIAALKA